jgi:hypothetical protein
LEPVQEPVGRLGDPNQHIVVFELECIFVWVLIHSSSLDFVLPQFDTLGFGLDGILS